MGAGQWEGREAGLRRHGRRPPGSTPATSCHWIHTDAVSVSPLDPRRRRSGDINIDIEGGDAMDAAASSRSRRPKRRSPTPAAAPPTTTPSPKIFLDTTWLIAKYTDNLLDELWNYIKEGKLAETAVLLLAAQEQIRKGTSLKRNGDSKPDGFAIIRDRILNNNITLHSEKDQQVEARIRLNNMALMLVHVISKAGEGLDSYIQKHLEVPHFMQVPHSEVIERVSSILKDNGFCPTSEWIEIGNLSPFEDVLNSAIDMGKRRRRR